MLIYFHILKQIKYRITHDSGAPIILLDPKRRTRMMSVVNDGDGTIPRYLAKSSISNERLPETKSSKEKNYKEEYQSVPTSYGNIQYQNQDKEIGTANETEPLMKRSSPSQSQESF